MNIELAVDHSEREEFAAWLRERGHTVKIGRSTGSYVDGAPTGTEPEELDDPETPDGILRTLWEQYCLSAPAPMGGVKEGGRGGDGQHDT